MSARVLPILFLLVTGSAVALASLPCKSPEEALAEAVAGYFLVQGVAAGRCDEIVGGEAFLAQHRKLQEQYKAQLGAAGKTRLGYFKRAYGDQAESERQRVDALMSQVLGPTLVISADACVRLKPELVRRLAAGWQPIQERLERRVAGVLDTDKNLCKP